MPTIRPIERTDHAQWTALRLALWPEEGEAALAVAALDFLNLTERNVGTMPEAVFVAVEGVGAHARMIGFAEVSRRRYAEGCDSSPVGFLEGWYVAETYRRQGVGRALVDAAEAWAREKGCREFASDALADNRVSADAHQALGFQEVEVIRCFRKSIT